MKTRTKPCAPQGAERPKREEHMPGAALPIAPSIPTAPVTSAVLDRLRAIVGDKGLILDEHDKRPFVTDWRGELAGQAAAGVRPAPTPGRPPVVQPLYGKSPSPLSPRGDNRGVGGAPPRAH